MSKNINFYWDLRNQEETIKQINILQGALCLACANLEERDIALTLKSKRKTASQYVEYYLQQAKEKSNEN